MSSDTPPEDARAPKSWEQRHKCLTAAIIAGTLSLLVMFVGVCIAAAVSDETDSAPRVEPTSAPVAVPTVTVAPTAIPTPSPTWTPTVVPTRIPPPSAKDFEAAKQMFDYTVSQMPGVLGADLTREGETVYIFVEVSRGFDPSQALSTGDNIVRQVLFLLVDGKYGQFIGETAYDYLIGFYYPDGVDAILTGEKKSRYRGVLWR